MDDLDEIIETLQMIHKDAVVVLDESRYVHLGGLAEACIKHLERMRDRLSELENDDTRH
jgi:hypothetical protein